MNLFSGSKLLHHLSRLEQWQKTALSQPILLEIDMTSLCDHKCSRCVCRFARNSDSLSLDDVASILKQSVNLGIKAILFTGGGEPLLNKYTINAMEIAKKEFGLDVGLITNGGLINKVTAKKIVELCGWCRISLDASNANLYTLAHGVNEIYWNKVIFGLKQLVAQKREINSDTTIGIGYLVDEHSRLASEIEQAIQIGVELNVDYLQFRPYRDTKTDIRPMVTEVLKKYADIETQVICSESRFAAINLPRSYSVCRAPNFSMVIGADFQVYVCCDTKYKPDAWIGNLREQTLVDIWYGELRKLKNGKIYDFCPHPCRHNSNNELLAQIENNVTHPNFI
jgi:MoaA/NifB/PqqE/SkfB family radical SAM enzyme